LLDPKTWTVMEGPNEQRPINYLTWFDAYAFCIWDGGFLPTEAEWEYVASGGQDRQFPWSNPPTVVTADPSYASYTLDDTHKCMGDGVAGCSVADLVFVGTKPAGNGRWGHADMAGNVAEWTLDWFWYDYLACQDCAHVAQYAPQDPYRVSRGGSYTDTVGGIFATSRAAHGPGQGDGTSGVRCARAP
jgi:formylglycine-generating enzyme required for sulfatase activity